MHELGDLESENSRKQIMAVIWSLSWHQLISDLKPIGITPEGYEQIGSSINTDMSENGDLIFPINLSLLFHLQFIHN